MMTTPVSRRARLAWLTAGFVLGAALMMVWPQSPAHAVATDRLENYGMATGAFSNGNEALYILDNITGSLSAFVLNPQNGQFGASASRSVFNDFPGVGGKPQFLMVTGQTRIAGRPGQQPSEAVLYIAELTTGRLAAYTVVSTGARAGVPVIQFVPLQVVPFRAQGGIRPAGAPQAPNDD